MKRVRPFPFDRLSRLARTQAEAGRTLLSHLPLDAGAAWPAAQVAIGGPVTIELVEVYAFPAREVAARVANGVRLRLAGAGDRGALLVVDGALAPRLARAALGVASDELAVARPLSDAEQGALTFVVAALLGERLRCDGFVDGDAAALGGLFPDPWVLALDVLVRTAVGDGWARLLVAERLRLQAPLPRAVSSLLRRRERLSRAAVALRLEVARTSLPRADFAALAVRDVVLFENFGPRPPFGGPVALRLGRGGFAASLGGDGVTIMDHFRLGASAMDKPQANDSSARGGASTDEAAAEAAAQDGLLHELPVEVVCELGRVTMTGRELLELRPGAVIPVGRPLTGPVDLTVGGRVVARGELVDVEGEIGVRVTQLHD